MIRKSLIYLIIPMQIILLLTIPRFGWSICHTSGMITSYASIYQKDGNIHCVYTSDNMIIDIAYKNRFSREFYISIDNGEVQYMKVLLDGKEKEEFSTLPFTGNNIVWNDSSGIFYRVYIFSLLLTILCIKLNNHANRQEKQDRKPYQILSLILLCVSLLISLRIII